MEIIEISREFKDLFAGNFVWTSIGRRLKFNLMDDEVSQGTILFEETQNRTAKFSNELGEFTCNYTLNSEGMILEERLVLVPVDYDVTSFELKDKVLIEISDTQLTAHVNMISDKTIQCIYSNVKYNFNKETLQLRGSQKGRIIKKV